MKMDIVVILLCGGDKRVVVLGLDLLSANRVHKALATAM